MANITNIKFLTWNIQSLFLKNQNGIQLCKLDIPEINIILQKYHIICLVETWTGEHDNFSCNNFTCFHSFRTLKHKRGKEKFRWHSCPRK